MTLKQKKKVSRKFIFGKGYCPCRNKQFVHGKGFMDVIRSANNFVKDNADTLKSTAETIGNAVRIGDSTKTIVQEIMKRRKPKIQEDNLQNIVDKINQFKTGSGFAYI